MTVSLFGLSKTQGFSSSRLLLLLPTKRPLQAPSAFDFVCLRCRRQQLQHLERQQLPFSSTTRRRNQQPADDPQWVSPIDRPSQIVRVGRRHGPGLILLALIPITAFVLGTWQVQRLDWKTKLIAKFEDRLVKPPLPLPPRIDPSVIPEFDYRRVVATGKFRHDQEMLIGPRMNEGEEGYIVITPLERKTDDGRSTSTVLISRGWISKKLKDQKDRPLGVPAGEVVVEGLLREPIKKNYFTPENRPDKAEFYFPDVEQMAELVGSQPVLIEETMVPDLIESYERASKGIPIGRPAQVNLRNNHLQYILHGTASPCQQQSCCGWLFANAQMKHFDDFVKAKTCKFHSGPGGQTSIANSRYLAANPSGPARHSLLDVYTSPAYVAMSFTYLINGQICSGSV